MSRSARSLKREVLSIDRGTRQYQRETGETIVWYEFDALTSTKDPVYDEGPSRKWKPGKIVPVIFAMFEEAAQLPDPEGFYLINTVHFTVQITELHRRGITAPEDTAAHMHDRFSFNGNVYSIDRYEKEGLLHGNWLNVAVDGTQVKDDETVTDDS